MIITSRKMITILFRSFRRNLIKSSRQAQEVSWFLTPKFEGEFRS